MAVSTLAVLCLLAVASGCRAIFLGGVRPGSTIVIGHRGASGYRPEHTLASYQLAIAQCADFIEPDLVSTKDGVLVVRHENEISTTTNVADHPEFASRRTTKVVDGASLTGWFTEDFTLAELKTLRARERIPQIRPENATYDGQFEIPTFQEVIDLAQHSRTCAGRPVGIYPETKHPSYFRAIGLPLEEPLVRVLNQNGYRGPRAPVFIQSFEVSNLQRLHEMTRLPLVQLVDCSGKPYDFIVSGDPRTYPDLVTPAGLDFVHTYADGVGACKDLIIPRDAAGNLAAPTAVVHDAHQRHLVVHAWTFRRENLFLPTNLRVGTNLIAPGDMESEVRAFLATHIDGLFTDNPDLGVAALQ